MQKLTALIVDDEEELRKTVKSILASSVQGHTWDLHEASNGLEAMKAIKTIDFDLVMMDVRMPELDGLETLKQIKTHDPKTFIVLMTAHSNLRDAVEAIKEGAYDYVEKPVKPDQMVRIVNKALEAREMVSTVAISNPVFDDDVDTEFVGSSQQMTKIYHLISRLAKVDTTVLIRGENGTGKELVAQAIHFNSPQKNGPFIAINCGAIPENLMETEFFGHEKGAFTGATERKIGKFQAASGGTLFLDEVGELSLAMQVKLLRILQEKKFTPVGSNREIKSNARIIAATNRNLEKAIEDGNFREDLFYRLNVMPLFLPPLRERREDIASLAEYFVKRFNKRHSRQIIGITPESLEVFKDYNWPGNIRELENAIERAFILENSDRITLSSLPDHVFSPARPKAVTVSGPTGTRTQTQTMDFDRFKEESEKQFIVDALRANKGKINQTVAHANIPKNTLLRKIKKYGIQPKDFESE